ncbi:MAG TPA: MBL fold metallo-hydrolase, partial [Actinopolymorphaceae bacterium]
MRLVKYTHSCVRLENRDQALVIDPGSFSEDEPLDGASAVLITHEHVDHLDPEKLRRRPDLQIWTNAAVADKLGDVGRDRIHVVADGDTFTVGDFSVAVLGEWHEVIHPDLPRVPNIGFLVNDAFFHPGDAYTVPDRPVSTLLVPVSAPWLRAADSIEYVRRVKPTVALAGHDGLYNDTGLGVVNGLMSS